MTVLTYNGYQGSVDYEDGHLVIQLLHIDDFVSITCDDAREVTKTFHHLVDDYLETCRQLRREPKKPYKGSLNIRMGAELHRTIAMAAATSNISLNSWIVSACHEKLRVEGNPVIGNSVVVFTSGQSVPFNRNVLGAELANVSAVTSGASGLIPIRGLTPIPPEYGPH